MYDGGDEMIERSGGMSGTEGGDTAEDFAEHELLIGGHRSD